MVAKKLVINGSIAPRWPKTKVLKWLEFGAIPTLLGLWLPNWVGGYAAELEARPSSWLSFAFPPLLSFAGALALFWGAIHGIERMGKHYSFARVASAIAILFAGLSLLAHFALQTWLRLALVLSSVQLALFFGTLVLLVTVAKVAEITTETRSLRTQYAIALSAGLALVLGLLAAYLAWTGSPSWWTWQQGALAVQSLSFIACRYGVYCYRTQKSIGASFVQAPEKQFWI